MVNIVKATAELYPLNNVKDILTHIEHCGRTCYKSENLITNETAEPFISGILKSGHESVIEHANVIFTMDNTAKNQEILTMRDIRGMSVSIEPDSKKQQDVIVTSGNIRAFRDLARKYGINDFLNVLGEPLFFIAPDAPAHFENITLESVQQSRFSELHNYFTTHTVLDVGAYKDVTRHRPASFSIESTRYCNYSKGKFGSELTMIAPCNIPEDSEMYTEWLRCMETIEQTYMKMAALGAKGDQLRMILPHSTKADMIMSANAASWRHIFSLRCHPAAHPSLRQVMKQVLALLYNEKPELFKEEYNTFITK